MPNYITNVIVFNNMSKQRFDELQERIRFDGEGFDEEIDKSVPTLDFNKLIPMPSDLDCDSGSITDESISQYLSVVNPNNHCITRPDLLEIRKKKNYSVEDFRKLYDTIVYSERIYLPPEKVNRATNLLYEVVLLGEKYIYNLEHYGHLTWYQWSIDNWGTKWNSFHYNSYSGEERKIPCFVSENTPFIMFDTAWSSVPKIITELSKLIPDIVIDYWWADEDTGCNVGHQTFLNGGITFEDIPEKVSKEAYEMYANINCIDLKDNGYIFNEEKGTYEWQDEDDEIEEEE